MSNGMPFFGATKSGTGTPTELFNSVRLIASAGKKLLDSFMMQDFR
jgi:hypothetical protein